MPKNELYEVVVSQLAIDDLNEIVGYYESLSHSYINSVIDKFENNINSLAVFPRNGRIIPELSRQGIEKYRELIQGNYRIVYEVMDEKVIVHTVIDSRRNFEDILLTKLMRYI